MAKAYFQGWYFKLQNSLGKTIAFIPAKHTEEGGTATTASLQVITDTGAYCVPFHGYQYIDHEDPFFVRLGENFFDESGLEVDIATPSLTVKGRVKFQQTTPIAYDIMGPFRYVPFMECRHSVISMSHRADGCITVNGEKYVFDNAIGYIEGDRGRSFPKEYAWTQCNFTDDCGGPGSLMLSVADIPLAGLHFNGVIAVVWWKEREYRLATYLGAKVVSIADGAVTIRQGPYTLTARLVEKNAHPLQAPVAGNMSRLIRESPACKAQYVFSRKGRTLFALDTGKAAFEYEYGLDTP